MLKVSFDFDGVLDNLKYLKLAKKFHNAGNHVFIITSRVDNIFKWTEPVYKIAQEIGIKIDKVIFTNGQDKYKFLSSLNIDIHYDDDFLEIELLEENNSDCTGIYVLEK